MGFINKTTNHLVAEASVPLDVLTWVRKQDPTWPDRGGDPKWDLHDPNELLASVKDELDAFDPDDERLLGIQEKLVELSEEADKAGVHYVRFI